MQQEIDLEEPDTMISSALSGWLRQSGDAHVKGQITPKSMRPDFTTANYRGVTYASYIRVLNDQSDTALQFGLVNGDADITADMDDEMFYVRVSNFTGNHPELAGGVSFSSHMYGPLLPNTRTVDIRDSGRVAFFGPNHEEVGGTYHVSSNIRSYA